MQQDALLKVGEEGGGDRGEGGKTAEESVCAATLQQVESIPCSGKCETDGLETRVGTSGAA